MGLRRAVDTRIVPALRRSVSPALASQRATIVKRVREKGAHLAKKPGDVRVWWNEDEERKRMETALRPHEAGIAETVARRVPEVLDRPRKAEPFEDRVISYVTTQTGKRITGILDTTRDDVQRIISQGFADGLSPGEVADLLEQATTFDDARSELIARTETMLAYNDAALTSYKEFDVRQVQAIDGDDDATCAGRNGQVFDVDEAYGISDHPNGTLDWVPYFGKAHEFTWKPALEVPQRTEPVVVNVSPPVMPRPPMRLVFQRDEYGKIASIVEEAV